jgi:hypothetical protein
MKGKGVAKNVSSMRTSGMSFAARNKGKIGLGAGAGVAGIAASRTRRSGLNKTSGRPTGMYKY